MTCAKRQRKWELFAQGLKFCGGCERTLSVSEFSADKYRRDGLVNRCRRCINKTTIDPANPCIRCGCPRSKGGAGVCRSCYLAQAKQRQEAKERFEPERILRRSVISARSIKKQSERAACEARKQFRCALRELKAYQEEQRKQQQRAEREQVFKYDALHEAVSYDAPISPNSEQRMSVLLPSKTATALDILLEQEALTIIVARLMREKGLNENEANELVKGFI